MDVSDALAAAGGHPPPLPLPRQKRLHQQGEHAHDEWRVSEAPHRCHARQEQLPTWLLKQRDDLFRETTSFTSEHEVREIVRSPRVQLVSAASPSKKFQTGNDATVSDSSEVRVWRWIVCSRC